jgi:hypothetical protein
MKYLRATIDMPLTLAADDDGKIRWWVDASFAIHPDMKGHTGATMSMGKGSIYSHSGKQKLVTRSSTESEIVGVHDSMPLMLWTGLFLKSQGLKVDETLLYQDNLSAILLEKNGKQSSSKRTRHMNIRYFHIKDRVDSKEMTIQHCPTADMLADFFTKPLQGRLFYKLRDQIMNLDSNSLYHSNHRSVLRTVDNVGAGTGIEGNNMEEDDGTDMEEDDGTDVIELENVPRKVELGNGDESWILVKKRRRGNADL